jgi:hypothetical protein
MAVRNRSQGARVRMNSASQGGVLDRNTRPVGHGATWRWRAGHGKPGLAPRCSSCRASWLRAPLPSICATRRKHTAAGYRRHLRAAWRGRSFYSRQGCNDLGIMLLSLPRLTLVRRNEMGGLAVQSLKHILELLADGTNTHNQRRNVGSDRFGCSRRNRDGWLAQDAKRTDGIRTADAVALQVRRLSSRRTLRAFSGVGAISHNSRATIPLRGRSRAQGTLENSAQAESRCHSRINGDQGAPDLSDPRGGQRRGARLRPAQGLGAQRIQNFNRRSLHAWLSVSVACPIGTMRTVRPDSSVTSIC